MRLTKSIKVGNSSSANSTTSLTKGSSNLLMSSKGLIGNASLSIPSIAQSATVNSITRVIKLNCGKDESDGLNYLLSSKSKNRHNGHDDWEDQRDNDEDFDDVEQDAGETSADNIIIDLDDIEQMVKNCDECFEEKNEADVDADPDGEPNFKKEFNLKNGRT